MRLDPAELGRTLSLRVWRQCRPTRDLLHVEDPASYPGRFHVVGDRATWYSSVTEQDAWAQFFRHHPSGGVDPFEVRRRTAGFEGILAPSAALKGERTLAVFDQALKKVKEVHSNVATPPAGLRAVRRRIKRAPWGRAA